MTALLLDEDDRQALLGVVRELAEAELAPLLAHPEEVPDARLVSGALKKLASIGVLGDDSEPSLSLWHAPDDPASCRLSLDMLETLAAVSPGVAVLAHVQGLAAWLDRSAATTSARSHVALTAAAVGGARAMGMSLRQAPGLLPADEQNALLNAWGGPTGQQCRLAFGAAEWSDLWWPEWTPAHGWRLRRTPRADLVVEDVPGLHGLDELTCQAWRLAPATAPSTPRSSALGPDAVLGVFAAHALGVLTIALATARRALERARAYSQIRPQGGVLIHRHDAVAQLLARAEHAVWTTRAGIDRVAVLPAGVERLHQAWRASAQLHPLLSAGGSDSLQVLGGVGYMRDAGAEKDQRDLNTLKLLGGSPGELTLRCAALDETATGRRP